MKMSHVAKRIKYCIVKTVRIAKEQLYSFLLVVADVDVVVLFSF